MAVVEAWEQAILQLTTQHFWQLENEFRAILHLPLVSPAISSKLETKRSLILHSGYSYTDKQPETDDRGAQSTHTSFLSASQCHLAKAEDCGGWIPDAEADKTEYIEPDHVVTLLQCQDTTEDKEETCKYAFDSRTVTSYWMGAAEENVLIAPFPRCGLIPVWLLNNKLNLYLVLSVTRATTAQKLELKTTAPDLHKSGIG